MKAIVVLKYLAEVNIHRQLPTLNKFITSLAKDRPLRIIFFQIFPFLKITCVYTYVVP